MLTEKRLMKKPARGFIPGMLATALALAAPVSGWASSAAHVEHANIDISNTASLQRGARNFVNYCMGCHSARYVRYNRLGKDLGLSDAQLIENLMFTGERPFDTMKVSMNPNDAKRWFGVINYVGSDDVTYFSVG